MKEIKFYGRGGQGAVMASQILATALFKQGYWSQTFPQYGAERRGAPVVAYVRFDKDSIPVRSKIYSPDEIIIMDLNLFKMIDPLAGIKPESMVLFNCEDAGKLPSELLEKANSLFMVDASSIAHEVYGKTPIPITNVVILGAYCAVCPQISLESMFEALPQFFSEEKIDMNKKAARLGFASVRGVS